MKNFDPENLSFFQVFIVCAFACLLLGPYLWLNGKIYDYDGARASALDHNGIVHIQVNNTLFRYKNNGQELSPIQLADLGVTDLFSDLTFNNNNELLLRKGKYETGFLENLAIYSRLSNKSEAAAHTDNKLSLCNLNSGLCKPFGTSENNFNRGFFSTVDEIKGNVFISDASRHKITKFSPSGQLLASSEKNFKFPNEMTIFEDQLYLVDTNNKSIKRVQMSTANFGKVISVHATNNPDGIANNHTWPYYITRVGVHWWVVLLDGNMDNGGVYLYDDKWEYIKSLNLANNSKPSSMLQVGSEVLISDVEGISVSRYSLSGQYLGSLEHTGLNETLKHNAEQRIFYRLSSWIYLVCVLFFIFMATVFAYILRGRKAESDLSKNQLANPAKIVNIAELNEKIKWIPKLGTTSTFEKSQQIQMFSLLAVTLVFAMTWFYITTYVQSEISVDAVSKLLLIGAIVLCYVLLISEASRVRLGVYQNQLILHDQVSNIAYSASNETILYDHRKIAFGKLSVKTSLNPYFGYSLAAYTKHVYPILAGSHVVAPKALYLWSIKNEKARMADWWIKNLLLIVCAIFYIQLFFSQISQ